MSCCGDDCCECVESEGCRKISAIGWCGEGHVPWRDVIFLGFFDLYSFCFGIAALAMINADGDVANETGLPSWATWLKVFGGVSLALVALVLGSLFAGCMADSREPCTRRWGHLLDRVTTILSLLAGVFLFAWSVVGWIMHFNYSSASIPSCSPAFEAAWAISSIIMWLGMGIGVFLAACGICRKED